MGLLKKIKDTFIYEEETEDDEIKKEVMQVEIKAPVAKEEEEKEEQEKKDYPIFFDDADFESLEKRDDYQNNFRNDLKYEYKKEKSVNTKVEDKKVFRPTPIISPVYGVLDKNYHKEDIVHKGQSLVYKDKEGLTIDDIRNKAFGTLEDDIENNVSKTTVTITRESLQNLNDDVFKELEKTIDKDTEQIDIFDELTLENKKKYDNIAFNDLVPNNDLDYSELLNLNEEEDDE